VELRHESYTAHCSGWQWKVAELVSISAYLLIQSPPLGIAPASVPSPRYCSCFSPLPSVSLLIQSPRRRGGRRAGATEQGRALCAGATKQGRSPRGCHGGGAAAARVLLRRGGRRAGATEGLAAARVPRRGWAPRGCHGGGGRRAGATEGLGAARVPRRGPAPRGCHGIAPDSVPSPRYLVSLQHRP